MRIGLKNIFVILVILLTIVGNKESFAQKIDAFARIAVSPREGVVRQAYKVNITVYSSTWFARPLQFANLQINNAFIIPFTRTVSGINYINNKKYATLTFYYLVFPYNAGEIEIPELVINANIPPENDFRGKDVVLKTKAQKITVNPVPKLKEEPVWMVAKNVSVKQSWSKPLANLKVGDVVEREIVITANGTLPALIQPLEVEKPDNVSIYPQDASLQDKRNNRDVNGERTERYSYLFEVEGDIVIPEEEIVWWNPDTKRSYKRTIPEQKISIAANPDLAIMESLKDSLLAMAAPVNVSTENESIPWTLIGFVIIAAVFTAYFGIKLIRLLIKTRRRKRAIYLQSETYSFVLLKKALQNKNRQKFIQQLYVWFDKARVSGNSASIYHYLDTKSMELMTKIMQNNNSELNQIEHKQLKAITFQLRNKVVDSEIQKKHTIPLNPV